MLQNKGWSLASALNKCPFRSLHQSLLKMHLTFDLSRSRDSRKDA